MKKNNNEYTISNNFDYEWADYYEQYTKGSYPVYVYYISLDEMILKNSPLHWHNEIEINFVKSGSALFNVSGIKRIVHEGESIVINKSRIHSISPIAPDRNAVILSLHFNISYLFESNDSFLSVKYENIITEDSSKSHFYFDKKSESSRSTLNLIENIIKVNLERKYGFELITKSLLCNFWIDLIRKNNADPINEKTMLPIDEERIKCGISYIHRNYMKALTLEEIADSIHVSRSECCRCFKRSTGLPPFEFLMQERIIQAAHKMQRENKEAENINALALSVGFNNCSYFNKIFKKYLNTTPSNFRNVIKKSHRDSLSPFGISLSRN